jgi:hypothetical protein
LGVLSSSSPLCPCRMSATTDVTTSVLEKLATRGKDLALLGSPEGSGLLEGLGVEELVTLAPLVPLHVCPVGHVLVLRRVVGAHPDALALVLRALPVGWPEEEEGGHSADWARVHEEVAALVDRAVLSLLGALPAPAEWGLPVREDLVPRLGALATWTLRGSAVLRDRLTTAWREWLVQQVWARPSLDAVLSVMRAFDVEGVLTTELVARLMWHSVDFVAGFDGDDAAFGALGTSVLRLMALVPLSCEDEDEDGDRSPPQLGMDVVGLFRDHFLPRMAALMTTVDAASPSGVVPGPLWRQWCESATMDDSNDDAVELPSAWMALSHLVLISTAAADIGEPEDPFEALLLPSMLKVYTVAADLLAEGGPLQDKLSDFGHPVWCLRELARGSYNRLLIVTNRLWMPAKPAALALMVEPVIRALALDKTHKGYPLYLDLVDLVAHWVHRMQRDITKAWPVLWHRLVRLACQVDAVSALPKTTVARLLADGNICSDLYDSDDDELPTWA